MKSIQDLREKRNLLVIKGRKLLDDHEGPKWNAAVANECDRIKGEIDQLDSEIRGMQADLNSEAERRAGKSKAPTSGWINAETGQPIPVAYLNRGDIVAQLSNAFPRGRETESEFTTADFMRGVAGMRCPETVSNALTEGTDSQGGYLLPAFLQREWLAALAPVSSLMVAGAGMAVLDDGAKSYRAAAVSTIPTAAWRSESGAVATSDPAFRAVDLTPRSLAFQFKVSREVFADAANLNDALKSAIAQAFAKELDRAGLRGSGSAPEIRGILNTSGIQAVTNGANGASLATTAYQNPISAMVAILGADGPMPTAAIMSPRSLGVYAGLLDSTNQPRQVPPLLQPWKQIPTSQIPNNLTVGTSSDCSEIYVGDFSTAAYFMREGISVGIARELYAGTGEIGFFCHTRVDFALLYPAAIAVVTGVRP